MNSLINLLKAHTKTAKALLVTLMAWAGISQLPAVQSKIQPLITKHPHLDTLIWSVTAIGFLLLRPQVQERVKEITGIDLASEQQKLQESKENIQSVQSDLKQAGQQASQTLPGGKV